MSLQRFSFDRPYGVQTGGSLQTYHLTDASDLEVIFDPRADCIQLTPGRFSADVVRLRTDVLSLSSCTANRGVQLRRWIGREKVLIGYINRAGTALEHGRSWAADRYLVVSGSDVNLSILDAFDITWIEVDASLLPDAEREAILRTTGRNLLAYAPIDRHDDLRSYAAAALQMCSADTLLLQNASMRRSIETELLRRVELVLAATTSAVDVKRERKSVALVQRVERFMWETVEEPLTLERICSNTNCRMRSLIYSFKDWCGLGPITYLKVLRLNATHRRLREARGDVRVFDVAADFGFWHMGHFSTDYKRMFGITPSETVAHSHSEAPTTIS